MFSEYVVHDWKRLADLKKAYLSTLVAPLDGMWESGFINPCPHWILKWDEDRIGYLAVDDGRLLQYYVLPTFFMHSRTLFEHVLRLHRVTRAAVGTNDPAFLSLCLDWHKSVSVHTYLYEFGMRRRPPRVSAEGVDLRRLRPSEIDRTVAFQLGFIDDEREDFPEWLRGYTANLIEKKGLFVLARGDEWIGLGEFRLSETQTDVVDLGMMVAPPHRRKGWATYILMLLGAKARAEKLHAICSTTVDNIGAQKAIGRAGFVTRHRILSVTF